MNRRLLLIPALLHGITNTLAAQGVQVLDTSYENGRFGAGVTTGEERVVTLERFDDPGLVSTTSTAVDQAINPLFSHPPARSNGCFRGLTQKANF